MAERLNIATIDPTAFKAVLGLEKYASSSGLESSLYELIKIRASQINGCAYCLDMHTAEAREQGEDQRRLDILSAWREAPDFFTPREQAALTLTEAITLIHHEGVPETAWHEAETQFSQQELVWIIMAICTINVWNRMAVSVHQSLPPPRDKTPG